jgi:hypothetical protein
LGDGRDIYAPADVDQIIRLNPAVEQPKVDNTTTALSNREAATTTE